MHELSLAQSIIEIVHEYVPDAQQQSVKSIRLKVGAQAGVVVDSLEFCFSAMTASTDLERARLVIDQVPFSFSCKSCTATFVKDNGIPQCPACNGTEVTILSGTELEVTEIELHELATVGP